ncbi:hypothetical protein E2I00_015342 [Balaenoptera physalus]|uniref:Ras association domain-containing protein 5 n=1 Tax=Balaenoptera physalus TaxID=9770 RepID=A0A643C1X5_BALPH|nr:hypothetical protein E2I00_015342 [Balaenoptera physalus]
MHVAVEFHIRHNYPWSKLPVNVRQSLGNSQREYEKQVVLYTIRSLWEDEVIPFLILRTIVHPPSHLCLFQNDCKPAEEPRCPPTLQEIKQKINSYNTREKNCLGMKLSEDGTYTGFIKVHLKLRRPVTVPAGIRPPSIYDAIKEVDLAATTDKRTSFYLPLDAIKQLHISSTTTVSEVIQGLLKKFMVVDNPQKFALFKRIHKDGQVLFQKLSVADCPLYLRLLAGPDTDVLSFWDAFSIPELQNFLTILEKEEQDKIQQVQKKYDKFRQKLEEALRESQGKPA